MAGRDGGWLYVEALTVGQGLRNGVSTREGLSPLSLSRDCCSPAHMDLLGHRVGAGRVLEQ